jgi:hypothetical protein
MKKQSFLIKWIFCLGIIVVLAGVVFALIVPRYFTGLQGLFYRVFNPDQSISSLPAKDLSHINWIYGVLGAVMIGWGMMIVLFSWRLFAENAAWIWNTIMISITIWYLVDTGISLYYKVILNVIINSIIFMLALIPYALRKMSNKLKLGKISR